LFSVRVAGRESLAKMWRTCVSTVFGVTKRRSPIPRSVSPSAISASDHDTAFADAVHCSSQLIPVEDAVLQEVAAPLVAPLEEPKRVLGLDVLREDEHADPGPTCANRLCGDESLVRVGRRHANVDDSDVGRLGGEAA
jgi:hypothetical protein